MNSESPANAPPDSTTAKFASVHTAVLQSGQVIARAISKTMAKRIANALNRHTPNREGV